MEFVSQELLQHASSYQSAPTSPTGKGRALQFYTAPSSPTKEGGNDTFDPEFGKSNLDEFEFSTSEKFSDYIDLEISQNFEYFVENQPRQENQGKPKRERGGSLPTMAFADELFYNGLVMPLKPPPRLLQTSQEKASFSQGSIPSSPKSPHSSGFKVPFVRRAAWNDGFDPFTVALQKVSEDSRGRASNAGNRHRRTRSHSPFRTNNPGRWNQHEEKMDEHLDQRVLAQKFGLPKEPKGSPYARFVIDQNKQVEQRGKGRKKPQKLQSGRRIGPVKMDHEENGEVQGNNVVVIESGVKRIRSFLLKYASFGRENNEERASNQVSTLSKPRSSYFKKLSFKIKGNASGNLKKRGPGMEPKMEIIEYKHKKPALALCLGYGFEHHKNMDYSQ